MKKCISLLLALTMIFSMMPVMAFAAEETTDKQNLFEGKTLSILGDSISTFSGVSNNTSYNSTIGSNAVYYSGGTLGVYQADTWWQQTIDALGMELLVNNSWSGSCILHTRSGTAGAYGDRCVNLHNDTTGEEPDVIVVFLGTNDFSYYQSALGTADIDYDTLITADGYAAPATSCEAYAIMLHKMISRYPNAEIYCMGMTARRSPDKDDGYADVGQPTGFNAELQEVIAHFGLNYVDLENCGIDADADIFDAYMGDARVHPNAPGMDKITEALVSALRGQQTGLCAVSYSMIGVSCDQSAKVALLGGRYTAKLTPRDGYSALNVTVTMGGTDVTASVYADGIVDIPAVTGDVMITASAMIDDIPDRYYWETDGNSFVNVTEGGTQLSSNALTMMAGTIADGIFSNAYFRMENPVVLRHDRPWSVEWSVGSGAWSGMIFSAAPTASDAENSFLFKTTQNTGFIGFGEPASGSYKNYGVALETMGVDTSAEHIYRAENRIAADGSNMAYLLVDGEEIGPMNNFFIGGNSDQGQTVDWIDGRDFCFSYIGASSHAINNCKLNCLSVTECNHTYTNGVCTACGMEHPNLINYENKVISILGDSISTFAGYIPTADGFNLEHYARYPQENLFTEVKHTWWMQVLTVLNAKLGINESWRSTEVGNIYDVEVNSGYEGTKACMASMTRIQNLGSNGTPDVILFYGGTNDITQRRTVGSFDSATAPTEVDLTAVKWDTVAEAYVAAIMRMQYYYPNAEIIAMLPTFTSNNIDTVIEQYNSVFAAICEHYRVTYIDLRDCGITTANLPDGTHPNEMGMDYITAAVLDILLAECNVEAGEHTVHAVTHELTGAESTLSYYKGVSHGKSFVTEITGEGLTVTVTMDGADITADCYANGVVNIACVTGDVIITAVGKKKPDYDGHVQQLPENLCPGVNLWTALEPQTGYFKENEWVSSYSSVTIPVTPGDRLCSASFGTVDYNDTIYYGSRITYFGEDGTVLSVGPAQVYEEFAANGFLTVPDGVCVINISSRRNDNDLYLLNAAHTYTNGVCTGCGAVDNAYIQQLPENILGCTNLYDTLTPVKGYYTATKYDTTNGDVLSVVIPVEPGDRIAASSFGSAAENMGSVNGIRVTYLLEDRIAISLSAEEVYNGYTTDGYITVPSGVDAVCIPWWAPSESNWLTLGQIGKDFAVHSPKSVPAQAPTCTEIGYTAGEVCEICNASLGERQEIPPTGHEYNGEVCSVCGAVNIAAILNGKYVSILGDSISTFNGYSNDVTVNTTIGENGPRYDAGAADTKPGSYCLLESVDDTWWMDFANSTGMNLLVNNSWAGSQVFGGQTVSVKTNSVRNECSQTLRYFYKILFGFAGSMDHFCVVK